MREIQKQKKVTSRQLSVISHLLASPSVEEACRRAKVSKPTVYAWMTQPAFKSELQRQRQQAYEESLDALKAANRRAVERVAELLESPKEEIALRACSQVMAHLLRLKELESAERGPVFDTPFNAEALRRVWERKKREQEQAKRTSSVGADGDINGHNSELPSGPRNPEH